MILAISYNPKEYWRISSKSLLISKNSRTKTKKDLIKLLVIHYYNDVQCISNSQNGLCTIWCMIEYFQRSYFSKTSIINFTNVIGWFDRVTLIRLVGLITWFLPGRSRLNVKSVRRPTFSVHGPVLALFRWTGRPLREHLRTAIIQGHWRCNILDRNLENDPTKSIVMEDMKFLSIFTFPQCSSFLNFQELFGVIADLTILLDYLTDLDG